MYTLKEIRKILNIQEQDRNEDSWLMVLWKQMKEMQTLHTF